MALADDLENIKPKVHSKQCTIGALLSELDDRDFASMISALKNDRIPHADLSRALRDNGHDIAAQTIARHRKQMCRCDR